MRWLICVAALAPVAWAESPCCGSGKCGEATKEGGYCFGQKSEASCHSHAVDDRPCTWVSRKGKSKCVKGKDCSHMTGFKPAQASKPSPSRAYPAPASTAEQPPPTQTPRARSEPLSAASPPASSRREYRIAERQAEREKRRPTDAASPPPPPLPVASSSPPPPAESSPPPLLLSSSSEAAIAAPSTNPASETAPSEPVTSAPAVPSTTPWATTRSQNASPTVRRPITPSELKERALELGGRAWEGTRTQALAAYERARVRLHKLVRKPLPFGLPPLIQVEQYKVRRGETGCRCCVVTATVSARFQMRNEIFCGEI